MYFGAAPTHSGLIYSGHKMLRIGGLLLTATLCGLSLASEAQSSHADASRARSSCAATIGNGWVPPGERPASTWYGNGKLWTALWPDGTIIATAQFVRPDGSIQMKFPWWRAASGRLRITGHRIDAPAPPLRAIVPAGYGNGAGFQASSVIFKTEGCWRVTGRVGRAKLTFVTKVVKST